MTTAYIESALAMGAALTAHMEAGRIRARLRWPNEHAAQSEAFPSFEEAIADLEEKASADAIRDAMP